VRGERCGGRTWESEPFGEYWREEEDEAENPFIGR
jgi:hypothetical protein